MFLVLETCGQTRANVVFAIKIFLNSFRNMFASRKAKFCFLGLACKLGKIIGNVSETMTMFPSLPRAYFRLRLVGFFLTEECLRKNQVS